MGTGATGYWGDGHWGDRVLGWRALGGRVLWWRALGSQGAGVKWLCGIGYWGDGRWGDRVLRWRGTEVTGVGETEPWVSSWWGDGALGCWGVGVMGWQGLIEWSLWEVIWWGYWWPNRNAEYIVVMIAEECLRSHSARVLGSPIGKFWE